MPAQTSTAASREKAQEACGRKTLNTFGLSCIKLSTEVSKSMEMIEIFWLRDEIKCPQHGETRAQGCLWFAYCMLRYMMFTLRVTRRELATELETCSYGGKMVCEYLVHDSCTWHSPKPFNATALQRKGGQQVAHKPQLHFTPEAVCYSLNIFFPPLHLKQKYVICN